MSPVDKPVWPQHEGRGGGGPAPPARRIILVTTAGQATDPEPGDFIISTADHVVRLPVMWNSEVAGKWRQGDEALWYAGGTTNWWQEGPFGGGATHVPGGSFGRMVYAGDGYPVTAGFLLVHWPVTRTTGFNPP